MLHLSTKNFKSYWLYWTKQSVYMYSTIVHINNTSDFRPTEFASVL